MNSNSSTVGPPSEKTERNIREAKAREIWLGPWHVEFRLWAGLFLDTANPDDPRVKRWLFFPRCSSLDTEVWNGEFTRVRWVTVHWLTVALSAMRRMPERREEWNRTHGTVRGRRRFDATIGGKEYWEE